MSEKLPTRREVKADQYEKTSNYQAMRYLTELGVFRKMNQVDLYHGRAGIGRDDWRVEPSLNNSDNNTGNRNINKIPALNTSNYETAQSFSKARVRHRNQVAEVHRIISDDPDAAIIDDDFNWSSLSKSELHSAKAALRSTLPSIATSTPLNFEDRAALENLSPRDFGVNGSPFVYQKDINHVAHKLGLKNSVTSQIAAAINTKNLLSHYPEQYLSRLSEAFVDNRLTISIDTPDGAHQRLPISREYLANWFRDIHAVGYKMKVRSATLKGRVVDNYLLFDLEKVNTPNEIEAKSAEISRRFGQISLAAFDKNSVAGRSRLTDALTDNLYIKPREVIDLAKQTPGFKRRLEADAGNWERFTLEEHTETVLRLFDENYADLLPASTLPLMRMALLTHDLGKSEAAKNHDKHHQKRYNIAAAQEFLRRNRVEKSTSDFIIAMIGNGMDYTKYWMLKRDRRAGEAFHAFCKETMQRYLGRADVDQKTILGFRNMLEILQTCDSAAYTTMAVTSTNNVYHRNAGSFDASFEEFRGLTGHRARLKNQPGGKPLL